MGYAAVWKILEELMIQLRQKKVAIPPSIMEDLKSTKTIIRIPPQDNRIENVEKIEQYLVNVESFLISETQRKFGVKCADFWLDKIERAKKVCDEPKKEARFIAGMPRQQKWIRVTSSKELPIGKVREMAEKTNMSYKVQKDGSLLVFGEEKSIKDFVKKMALKYETKGKK